VNSVDDIRVLRCENFESEKLRSEDEREAET